MKVTKVFLNAALLLWCAACVGGAIAEDQVDGTSPAPPEMLSIPSLPNACRLHEKVISGGQPAGPSGFLALQKLGVRTIVSVDGAMPDVELARAYGLTYVHLPHGYDGIPDRRAVELAKAVRDLPGPIYIHCHHGKHRSPAAAAVACVGSGYLSRQAAPSVLKLAGTSEDYRGLHQVVASAVPIRRLDTVHVDYKESVDVPPLAATMVRVERSLDQLTKIEQAGWQVPKAHPDLSPEHEALMLRELFSELLRNKEIRDREQQFRKILQHSRDETALLEKQLQANHVSATGDRNSRLSATLSSIRWDCKNCHRQYRD